MLYYLSELQESFPALNVLRYITFRAALAGLLGFVITVVFGKLVIAKLQALKAGQPIRGADEVHRLSELHGGKSGTPTMGGVLIIGAVLVATLLCVRWENNPFVWMTLVVMLSLGALGFADDFLKVRTQKTGGVRPRVKFLAQGVLALVVTAFFMNYTLPGFEEHMTKLYMPFLKEPVWESMGWLALVFFASVIVGSSNAVNLTDGLDGLAIGCTITVALVYGILNYLGGRADIASEYLFIPHHPWSSEVSILCMALAGAGLGFLWFNCHPAKVFMGDTGSLAIGGTFGMVAISCKQELLLIIVGGVFVMEAGSVILQVASFKLRGKRIFRMAPLHHHFELMGWPESRVITRFWILSVICALAGLATLKLR